jgi:hypothetical protein
MNNPLVYNPTIPTKLGYVGFVGIEYRLFLDLKAFYDLA